MGNRFSKIGITCFSSFKDYLKAKILFYFIFSFLILKYLTNVMMPQFDLIDPEGTRNKVASFFF